MLLLQELLLLPGNLWDRVHNNMLLKTKCVCVCMCTLWLLVDVCLCNSVIVQGFREVMGVVEVP